MNEPKKAGVSGMLVQFEDAQRMRPRPAVLAEQVRRACADRKLWADMWPYLTGTAGTDSREFDHALAVDRLLDWDAAHNNGGIAKSNLSHRKLWRVLSRQIGNVFDMENGHIAGLLEAPSEKEDAA